MHLNLVARLVVLCAFVACALAFPSPTTPVGDTVWNVGDNVDIEWEESGADPTADSLSGINIYFMTGPDIGQIKLDTIAENLDNTATSAQWTVPPLKYPAGKIYFIMFTDSKNPDSGISWSTRFRVLDGTKEVTYNPKDPWTIEPNTGESNQTDSNDPDDTDDKNDNDTDTDDPDDDDDTDDTESTKDDDSTEEEDDNGKANAGNEAPTVTVPPPSQTPPPQDDAGNSAPRFIPAAFVSTFVTLVAAAVFFA